MKGCIAELESESVEMLFFGHMEVNELGPTRRVLMAEACGR